MRRDAIATLTAAGSGAAASAPLAAAASLVPLAAAASDQHVVAGAPFKSGSRSQAASHRSLAPLLRIDPAHLCRASLNRGLMTEG